MALQTLVLEKREQVAYLTFNRPDVLNAINETLMAEMKQALAEIDHDAAVRVVIITGAGKAFMAGADIAVLAKLTPLEVDRWNHLLIDNWSAVEKLRQPVIAAINGYALGGGLELALACDIRVASEKARLGLPEVKLGLIPGTGGPQRLSRLVGRGRALEMILTGEPVTAAEAYRIGLVNKVVPDGELMKAAEEMAAKIKANGPIGVALAKDAVWQTEGMPLDAAIAYGHRNVVISTTSADAKEGLNAFVEKRPPHWQGK
ncbi:MAG: enoyl-CoA hydratase/isomerase family protein [Chloroflexota bacterium]